LGIVAASAKREALGLAGFSDLRMHGVLGVECSNHSVPTIIPEKNQTLKPIIQIGFFVCAQNPRKIIE
jgi:hypothetical protein